MIPLPSHLPNPNRNEIMRENMNSQNLNNSFFTTLFFEMAKNTWKTLIDWV